MKTEQIKINQIIVLKESRKGEARVALTPSSTAMLVKRNLTCPPITGSAEQPPKVLSELSRLPKEPP
jgi:hypothetical protein